MDIDVPRQRSTTLVIFLLLLVIVVGIAFAAGSLSAVGTATTTTTQQCPPFDAQAEAFRLAQAAEQFRTRNPTPRNYGLGSYVLCYISGRIDTYQTPVFSGVNDNTGENPINSTHSEPQTYHQLQKALGNPTLHTDEIVNIFVIIFTQVRVCRVCAPDMISWQSTLRQIAGVEQLSLSIWQLRLGNSSFDPRRFPQGLGIPITLAGVQRVSIPFAP